MSRSDEWIGADTPLDEFFVGTDQQGTYDPQEGIAPETLGEMFTAGSTAGGWGMEANINYLDAAFQAITGDEWEMEQALDRARIAEEFAGEAMKDLPVWADFVNEPTAEGFFEQASIGLGQFLPSAFNSIAAATLVGGLAALTSASAPAVAGTAAVGTAVVSAGGRQIFSKAGLKAAKKIFRDAMDKKSRKLKMSQAEWDLNEGVYSTAKKMFIGRPGPGRAGRYGAYVGAGGQEGAMGTGITFGEFARQDMTSPREAAISFGVGVPYALVGLGSEALALRYVFGPLMKVASTRAAKSLSPSSGYHSLVSDLSKIGIKGASKGIAVGGGVGMLAEGGAEAIQDTMTGLQKLAIDPNYDSAQMKMDIMESAFKGAIGGFALGGAGRGVTQAARDMINEIQLKKEGQIDMFGPDEDLNKQRRDLIKVRDAMSTLQQDLDSIKIKGTDVKTEAPEINFPDLETRQMDIGTNLNWQSGYFFDMVPDFGAPMEESMEDIKAQFRASLSGHSGKDSVWIPQGHTIPSKQELDSIYGNKTYYSENIPGRGTIFSISKGKVNYVVNQNASDEALAQVLGMYEPKNASHDRGILVKDKEGRVVHSETTNAQNQEAVIELQKETFNKTEQGKATYIVDEQPRHLEDIAQDRRDSFIEEVESGSYVTRAVDEFNNALNLVGPPKDRQQVVENVLGRYIDNYPVLKAIYDNLKGKKDEPSIKARELLQDRLVGMLKDMNKKYSEALGIPVDAELTMALAGLNPNFGQEKTIEKASPTTKITAELEMAQEEQSKELGAITTGEEGVAEGAETTGVEQEEGQLYGFSIIGEMDESQFNKVTIIGKEGTINQEAQPWQIARPRGNESQEIFNLSQDILSTMTADEAATFSSNQLMMANTPFNFPIGVLKAYKEVRAAQPNATLKIRSRYIAKETSTLKTIEKAANNIFTPFNVLEFFNRNPNLAMASGLKYQELGFVIETTTSPEEILIEYDDTGSKIKGKLTPDQYFKRLVVEARRSKQEFREKSNWTLVSPDGKVEKVNIVSMIKGARAIVNAEGNYVPGDLKSVYQAMTSLFALADRNGYDFKLDNKSLLRNEFTPGQLLNSKAVVYVSHRPHTFGELLRYNLTNETSYGDMLGQSANLLEAILDKSALNKKEILELVNGGPGQIIQFVDGKWKETQKGKTYRDFAQFNEEETAIVPEISMTDEGMLAKELFTEAKKIRDPKKAKDIRTRAKALQRSADLFAFKDILDGLYQVAVDQEVDLSSYELGYTGLDKDTFGVEERFAFDESELDLMLKSKMISDAQESGMEVSDWYDTPAKDMVHNSKYSYVTEYANRQYSSSSKTNHTLRSKNRKINITESESFKKHLGVVNDQFNAVLREFKYFGVSNDIHFMTFEDFIHPNSKPSKAQKILNEWYGPKMADNLAKAYWHRRKNAPDGEGLTIRASKNSPWIVVIDTGPLLNAKTKKKFAVPTNVPIKSEKKAKGKAWARYNKKEGVVYLDESELRKRFKDKAWTKPKVKGVKALPEGQFKTLDEWRNFVTRHEFAHSKYLQGKEESKADYENRINQLALAVDERGQDIIDETAAVGQVVTALAHELAGHVVIQDTLNDIHFKPWRDKLYKEYQKAVNNGYKFSFDEWVSDQAGIQLFHYATNGKFKPATNAVDSFFRRIAKQILDIWTSIVDGIGRKRMNLAEPNEVFGQFWQEAIRLSKEGYAFDRAEGKLNHMEQKQIYDMVEQTAKPFNLPPSLWKQLSNKVSDIVQDLQSPGGISRQTAKLLYSASGFAAREEFGAPGKRASDFFYHLTATATKDGEGLTYLQQQTRDFIQLSNEFGKTINIDETGSVFLGLDEEATSALYLYQNDTITDKQLLDEKKYGGAGKMAHDLRVGFMRERVFFGYAMADGKDGTPVMKKLKLEENYQTPGDESTKVSFAHREWWLDRIRSEDTVRQDLTDVMVKKIINRTLLGYKKNGEAFVIEPNNLEATKDMPVEEFAQWWAETKITNILRLPHDNTLAESIPADILETEINNVDIGFPAALARTFRVQYLPDLDGAVDENGNPIIKMYGILNQELEEIGALVDPQLAMVNYLRTLTKKFAFEDRGGRAYLENLVENTPGHLQPHLRGAIQAMMGKLPAPLDPWFKRINSYGMFLNIITTLTFSALASFPDLAGPILRSREMDGFRTATKEYINYFENKEEAIKFAMDLGIVSQDTLATMYINAAEMDYMTLGTKKATDMFFRMIMLEQFTKFTRVFAANMGRAFLINLAHNNTKDPAVIKRWLKELGVTKEEILAWEKTKTAQGEYDFTTPEGRKVSDAIYRFVDESIIRPNAAQRPTWASNPYFALVWQLKGFFYAYGKTIMGGQGREIMNRYREAGLGPAMIPIAMMAMTILPLTMVGLEVREAVKYGMGGVLPGVPADPSVFKTDDMDGGTYTYEIFDRSGMAGSWGILLPILSGREYGGPFEQGASLLGPTSDKIGDLLKYGPFDNRFIKGQIPLYYTLPSQE